MSRRRGVSLRGTILTGIGLMPVVCLVTFVGLVLAAQAMDVGRPQLDAAAQDFLAYIGLVAVPPAPQPASLSLGPPPASFQIQSAELNLPTETSTPTSTPSPTSSPSPTSTPSDTPTETPTSTLTPTATSTSSATASPTRAPTAPRTRTPTLPPTRTATRTPTRTATEPPPPTASDSPEGQPTEGEASSTPDAPPTVAAPTVTPTIAPTVSTCDAAANTSVEGQVISLINAERVAQGLAAYAVDSRLTAAARVHANDMACNHFASHTGSDGSSVRDRVERQGYAWSWIGENFYVTGDTANGAQTAFDWWMNSTLHRNNLLSPNYTQFGVGYVHDTDSDYGGYFVVVFARPG